MCTLTTVSISVLLLVLLDSRTTATDEEAAYAEPIIVKLDDGEKDARCSFVTCLDDCRKKGHLGGYCWGDKCNCWDPGTSKDIVTAEESAVCNQDRCLRNCRKSGHLSGSCQTNICVCGDEFLGTGFNVEELTKNDEDDNDSKPCDTWACSAECRKSGHRGGYCARDGCRCLGGTTTAKTRLLGIPVNNAQQYSGAANTCTNDICNYMYVYRCPGNRPVQPVTNTCTGSTCNVVYVYICRDNHGPHETNTQDEPLEEAEEVEKEVAVDEDEGETEPSRCKNRNCRGECRESGYRSGYCRRGECRCIGGRPEDLYLTY